MRRRIVNLSAEHIAEQRDLVRQWNAMHKPGIRVEWTYNTAGNLDREEHATSGKAFLLGGHTAHIALRGRRGTVPLEQVTAAEVVY